MVRIIEESIEGGMYDSPIFSEYFSGMNVVVADIETTGLSPKRAAVILCGAVLAEGKNRRAVQFFADTAMDEQELLKRFAELLSQADIIVTFNGQRFDLPFLKTRMERHGMSTASLDRLYSMDLYRILRYHSHLPKILPNLKQKTVETFLGDSANRRDEIDGAQSVELYYEYTQSEGSRREQLLRTILLHNRDDIVRLADMMRILKILNLHEILNANGFPAIVGESTLHVEKIRFKGSTLRGEGRVFGPHSAYKCFEDLYEFELSGDSDRFFLTVFCEKIQETIVADVAALGIDSSAVRETGGYESGFLILKEGDMLHYRELNLLVRSVLGLLFQ